MRKVGVFLLTYYVHILLGALLCYLLWWRWRVGMTRFFDVDEFSYMHWAADFARGQRPYTDFFMFFTPGFLWLFGLIVAFFPFQSGVFIAGRVVAFVIFVGMAGLVSALFGKTRSVRYMLLPAAILAFLPMPYDKMMEIRPDNLATLLALGGLVSQVFALEQKKYEKTWWFVSGFFYMCSLLVFVKTIPFVIVGYIIAVIYPWWGKGEHLRVLIARVRKKQYPEEFLAFVLGNAIPFGVFILWVLTIGDLSAVWYSLVKLPFEANMISRLGIMEPHLFFFPNGSFYGGTTNITLSLVLNHVLWFVAILTGTMRFFTPFFSANGERKKTLAELLISAVFIISAFGYVQFFPLKHSQYLIPIAVFIAYYAADFIVLLVRRCNRLLPFFGPLIIVIFIMWVFVRGAIQTNTIKLSWSNTRQLEETNLLLSTIPPSSQVLDLEGRMLFWKDAYYICCVPFGSFVPYMTRQPPVLRTVLEEKKTPYIFQSDSNRLYILDPNDLAYIRGNYTPVPGWGEALWERNKNNPINQ